MAGPLPTADVAYMEFLFQAHSPAVRRLCMSRLKDPSSADDVVQEVFHRAALHIDKLRQDPLPWLMSVGSRLCVSEFRHRDREGAGLEQVTAEGYGGHPAVDPTDEVLAQMTVDDLLTCLTTAERRVVVAKCLNDLTHEQVARALGISSGTTRQLMLRARRRMAAYLARASAPSSSSTPRSGSAE
jgi:RNA polymerase sigma-70 factor (ECF subfamily)